MAGLEGLELVEERRGVFREGDEGPVLGADEALLDGAGEVPVEEVVVAADVEQAQGLVVDAQLRPGGGLEEFLEYKSLQLKG